jgi:predicted RNase H-like nuclease (RuvC/YqgF family)
VIPHRIEGLVKTVRAFEVETWTDGGWVVVGSYQDTITKTVPELADSGLGVATYSGMNYQDANGLWQPIPAGKTVIYKHVLESVTFFVLQKDTESALAEMSARLKASESKFAEIKQVYEKKNAETEKDYKTKNAETEKEYKTATDLLKKSLKEAEEALKNATSGKETDMLNKQIKKLEADLDQARKDIEEAKRDLDEARQERFGVRRVDLTEDVA